MIDPACKCKICSPAPWVTIKRSPASVHVGYPEKNTFLPTPHRILEGSLCRDAESNTRHIDLKSKKSEVSQQEIMQGAIEHGLQRTCVMSLLSSHGSLIPSELSRTTNWSASRERRNLLSEIRLLETSGSQYPGSHTRQVTSGLKRQLLLSLVTYKSPTRGPLNRCTIEALPDDVDKSTIYTTSAEEYRNITRHMCGYDSYHMSLGTKEGPAWAD
jgi:hypothetical protein